MTKWWAQKLMDVGVNPDGSSAPSRKEPSILRIMETGGEPLTLARVLAGATAGDWTARQQLRELDLYFWSASYPQRRLEKALELLLNAAVVGNQAIVEMLLASFSPDERAMIDTALATKLQEPSYDDGDDDDE